MERDQRAGGGAAVLVRVTVGADASPTAVIPVSEAVPFHRVRIPWRLRLRILRHGSLTVWAKAVTSDDAAAWNAGLGG